MNESVVEIQKNTKPSNEHNRLIKFMGVTIYLPSLSGIFSIMLILIFILILALTFSFLIHRFPQHFENFKSDLKIFNISLPISFDKKGNSTNKITELSDNISRKLIDNPEKRLQISFWTPDEDTWSSIRTETERNDWQKDIDKNKNIEFMNEIYTHDSDKKSIFSGLRNFKVCGKGSETYKCGLWWVATASKDIQLNEFLEKYQNFWNNSPGVYLELNIINSQRIN